MHLHRLTTLRVWVFRGRECLHALSAETMADAFALLRLIVADALDPLALDDGTTRVEITEGDAIIRRVRITAVRVRRHRLHMPRVSGRGPRAALRPRARHP